MTGSQAIYSMTKLLDDQKLHKLFREHWSYVAMPEDMRKRIQYQMLSEVALTLQTNAAERPRHVGHRWQAKSLSIGPILWFLIAGAGILMLLLALIQI